MKVLFTGYAPVHFACFQPMFEALSQIDDVDVRLSGGVRAMTPRGVRYDLDAMYGDFGVPDKFWLEVEEIKNMDFDILFIANTGGIMPAGVGATIQIFHGMSFRNLAIRQENMGCDYYFFVGPYMKRGFESRGLISPGDPRAVEIGFPKTDRLVNGALDRRSILDELGVAGDRPVILYAPTGAKGNSLETFGETAIRALAAEDRYDILIKLHDHPKGWTDWWDRVAGLQDPHVRVVLSPDIIPTMFASDLLISDASSASNEYALTDKPMVFLDVPGLIDELRAQGSMIDLDTWGRKAGPVVSNANETVAAVSDQLANPSSYSEIRREMVADLFYNPGTATPAAIDWLRNHLLGRPITKQPVVAVG